MAPSAIHQDSQRQREGGDLGRRGNEQGHARRGALVHVREPHVEWHGAELEGDADQDEAEPDQRGDLHDRRPSAAPPFTSAKSMLPVTP